MKNWETPDVVTLNVNKTANGAKEITTIDNVWYDDVKGEVHADFVFKSSGDGSRE